MCSPEIFPFYCLNNNEVSDLLLGSDLEYNEYCELYFKHAVEVNNYDILQNPDFQLRTLELASSYYDIIDCPVKNSFRILSLNIRSLPNKFDSFLAEFQRINYDALMFCETWLHESYENFYNFPGFCSFHQSRNGRGGGVSTFISNKLNSEKIDNLSFCSGDMEVLTVKTNYHGGSYIFINVYRPPKSNLKILLTK